MKQSLQSHPITHSFKQQNVLAILVDPDKFKVASCYNFLKQIPIETTHIFVGGSTVAEGKTEELVKALKELSTKPIILFPGNVNQITPEAHALLFLSLLSGENPEYLIGQQLKAVEKLKHTLLEVVPTAYILIDGGNESAVARVTQTQPIPQENIKRIVHTAKAAEYLGKQLIYLEAGSGAQVPVSQKIIREVKKEVTIPILVGGGIKTHEQRNAAYQAGANGVVMGTVFEEKL